jgi:predicted  nucleic acid-binding Zn-ribbon protein
MTLGAVGLILAILATIVALNAREVADFDQATSADVQEQVSAELDRRARQQKRQLRRIGRFVNQLSGEEKAAVRSLATLKRKVGRLSGEVAAIESDQSTEFAVLERKIANLRQQIQRLKLATASTQP